MRAQFVIPVLVSILILGTFGLSYNVFADFEQCANTPPSGQNNGKSFLEIWEAICDLQTQINVITTTIDWSAITGIPDDITDGDDDTLGDLVCLDNQVPKFITGSWTCADDNVDDADADPTNEIQNISSTGLSCENQLAIAGQIQGFTPDQECLDGSPPDPPTGPPEVNPLVINEIDYDQPGFDTAEFVEIYNPSSSIIDLSSIELVFVDGGTNAVYHTVDLSLALQLFPDEYLVVGSSDVLNLLVHPSARTLELNSSIQNGSPDCVLLFDTSTQSVIDALSYEGSITNVLVSASFVNCTEGTALTSEDINDGSLNRIPNGVDSNDNGSDFIFSSVITPGLTNDDGETNETGTLEFTVSPAVAYSGISTTITITGTEFDSLATVTILTGGVIENGVELSATVNGSTEISAIVPFDLATGLYDVVVENDDGTFGNLGGSLLITDSFTIEIQSVTPSVIPVGIPWNVFVRATDSFLLPVSFVDFSDPTQVILVLQSDPNHNGLYMPTTFLSNTVLDAEVTLSALGTYDLFVIDATGNVGLLSNAISVQEPTTPSSGDLVITEVMVDPDAVLDVDGEWFEIVNVVNNVLSLNDLVISDLGTDSHTFTSAESVLIAPGQHFVFARNADSGTNGGVIVDYQYNSFTLGNTGDEIILSLGGVEIDQVAYDNSWPYGVGIAMQLDSQTFTSTENDLLFNWCESRELLFSGDAGTPGDFNHFCAAESPF